MSHLFEISYYILIGVLSVLGLVLFVLPTRDDDPRLEGYKMSVRLMAVSFLSLALYCSFKWAVPRQLFSFYFLLMAHLQCNLLGMGHINMVAPNKVTKNYVWLNILPLLCCLFIYVISLPFCGLTQLTSYGMLRDPEVMQRPEVFLRVLWMGVYLINTVYVALVFFREEKAYRRNMRNYFSEIDARALSLTRWSFIFALCVAVVTVFITASLHPVLSAALNGCILIFYTTMAVFYIQYPTIFPQMEPVIYEAPAEPEAVAEEEITGRTSEGKEQWTAIRLRIVEEDLFLRPGLTLESLARELAVSRTRMSRLINTCEQVNFNTFINRLRVQRACELMRSQPDIRFAELAEKLGYADVSNFHRSFKLLQGKTPRQFRIELEKRK